MQTHIELINTVVSHADYKEMETLISYAGELSTKEKEKLLYILRSNKGMYRYGDIKYG